MPPQSILVVEDERVVARDLQRILERLGYQVPAIAATAADAIIKATALQPDLLLMDIRLQDESDGISAAASILAQRDIPVVYLTAFSDDATRQRARQTAPYGYLVKPFDERTVQTTVEMALERHTRDHRTRTQGQWLAATLANLGDAVVTADSEGRITFINPAAQQLLRCAPAEARIGTAVIDLVILRDAHTRAPIAHPLLAALHAGAPPQLLDETILIARDGREIAIAGSIVPIRTAQQDLQGAVLVFQERAEPRVVAGSHAQEQVDEDRQIQRLRVLAGGIAHNFNNLLTVVLGNAELAGFAIPQEHPAHESLAQIAQVSQRAAELTGQLRAYASDVPAMPELLDLNALVRQAVASLSGATATRVAIHPHLAPDLPAVEADAIQMHRVVQQILVNAAEAIGKAEGIITITTCIRQIANTDLAKAVTGTDLPPGRYVALQIADSGCGMDEAILSRIFDPFFSTKFTGRGLGLPAVLGIVRQHGGALIVDSAAGRGTTFTVLLAASA
jgi:signal transduction histidine kinase